MKWSKIWNQRVSSQQHETANRGPLNASSFEEFNVALLFSCVFEQAEKNVYLEERLQVLQQQNEDLKERIDKNVAVSRSVKF